MARGGRGRSVNMCAHTRSWTPGQRLPARRIAITSNPSPKLPPGRDQAPLPDDATPACLSADASAAPRFPAGMRAVVAEDDRVSQAVITQILRRVGLEVHVAGNGRRALELIRELSPALVMMDMQMPDLDGPEVIRLMRADAGGPQPAVVVLSANPLSRQHSSDLAALGVVDSLIKPVNRTQLYASLTRLLPKA